MLITLKKILKTHLHAILKKILMYISLKQTNTYGIIRHKQLYLFLIIYNTRF